MTPSPLGRYSEVAATMVALAVIAAWIAVHLGLVTPTTDAAAIDTAATLVVGIVLGQRATTNGAGRLAQAAHKRLDLINAPPADDGSLIGPEGPAGPAGPTGPQGPQGGRG